MNLSTREPYRPGWFVAGLTCFSLTFFGTWIIFMLVSAFLAQVHQDPTNTAGFSSFLGVVSVSLSVSFFLGLFMSGVGIGLRKAHTTRRLLIAVGAMIFCFCAAYLLGDLIFASPQQQLLDAIREAIERRGFGISRRLARHLGWLSIVLFPLFIVTGLVDLICMPFAPFFDPKVHAEFFKVTLYSIGLIMGSALPAMGIAWPLMRHYARLERHQFTATSTHPNESSLP